ncbi:uncharacterized protein TNCV_5075791 [Trichonephila clavipes]|uniref:Retrotransposon gag domain-containing protein n=1 Tax=Trichonephila clavipes TaxID=2585209 RepID=A0A8X6RSS8_TRICX|nr:uncharacterized protein TNCV_5075791 [Trichonephila clavipes]
MKWLAGQDFAGDEELKNAVTHWFKSQAATFYTEGIGKVESDPILGSCLNFFSRSKNVNEFLECLQNNVKLHEIPSNVACAYQKGHLTGGALDWFEVLGYSLVQGTATDFTQLKEVLTENFPVVRNKTELEVRFYSSYQSRGQAPSDFIYDLLKIHKRLGLSMLEESLVEHIIARLEPQLMEYLEIRNPTSRSQLLKMITKYEDRYLSRETQSPSNNTERRD